MEYEEMCEKLAEQADSMDEPMDYVVGDIVTWKGKEMVNRKIPTLGGVAIVREILAVPHHAEPDSPSSPYHMDMLNIVVGVLDEDGDYLEFKMDGRRFRKFAERITH